jgi:hypothetical protein
MKSHPTKNNDPSIYHDDTSDYVEMVSKPVNLKNLE